MANKIHLPHCSKPEKLDEKIQPAVTALKEKGYVVLMSCQGGPGHGRSIPVVGLILKHEDVGRLASDLNGWGFNMYDLRLARVKDTLPDFTSAHTTDEVVYVLSQQLLGAFGQKHDDPEE